MKANAHRERAGFTLIELLVVVAIIALLISILLPSLRAARKQGKQVVCLSNLRSQGAAASFYKEDNDGWIPCGIMSNMKPDATTMPSDYHEYGLPHQKLLKYLDYSPPGDGKKAEKYRIDRLYGERRWVEVLGTAYRSMEVYQCPDFPFATHDVTHSGGLSDLDYITNAMPIPFTKKNAHRSEMQGTGDDDDAAGVPVGSADYYGHRRESSVTRPGDFIYMTEVSRRLIEQPQLSNFRFHAFFIGPHIPFAQTPRIASDQRHPGGLTALFFDNHAEAMSLKKIDPAWPHKMGIRLRWFSDTSRLPKRWW